MHGAELDTRRRALGLSVAELAHVLGVSERIISYWVAGDGSPRDPDQVAARLQDVETAMGDLVDYTLETLADAGVARTILARYRTQTALDASGGGRGLPLGAHAMAMAWLADDLRGDGIKVDFRWNG